MEIRGNPGTSGEFHGNCVKKPFEQNPPLRPKQEQCLPCPIPWASRGNLGKCCYHMRNFTAAEKYLKEALKQQTKLYGKNHRNSVATVSYLGEVLMQAKQFEQAYPLMLEQLEQSKLVDEQQGIEMSEKSASFACANHESEAASFSQPRRS